MELDPRLQDLTPVDIHGYSFAPAPGFDTSYSNAIYNHGLGNEHNIPSHAQGQFNGSEGYFEVNSQHHQLQPTTQGQQHSPQQTRRENIRRTRASPGQRLSQNGHSARNIAVDTSNLTNKTQLIQHGEYPIHTAQGGRQQHMPQAQYVNHHSFTTSSPMQQSPNYTRANANAASISSTSPQTTAASTISILTPKTPTIPTHSTIPRSLTQPIPTPTSSSIPLPLTKDLTTFTPPSTFPLVPSPPDLAAWRAKFFNITTPILLTSEQYHTYFPHVDNIYSHRSTQKYKRKPFVSHYWDCRLKGRPTGTPLSKKKGGGGGDDNEGGGGQEGEKENEKEKKKRKRKTRERDLCDVKIKVTEFFGQDELELLGAGNGGSGGGRSSSLNYVEDDDGGEGSSSTNVNNGQLTFVHEDGSTASTSNNTIHRHNNTNNNNTSDTTTTISIPSFGILEPPRHFPPGHPGAQGKRWYMVQRVNGTGKDGEDNDGNEGGKDLDHKHTLEESDRIKKNSVQRWLLAQEKERKKAAQRSKGPANNTSEGNESTTPRRLSSPTSPSYQASGEARQTAKAHAAPAPSQLTFYSHSYCPFAQRIWIALELKGIPYQYVEITPAHIKDGKCTMPEVLEICPEGIVPCIRHGNFAIWESNVMMEYLEDLAMGHSLLPLGNPQLRAHCRLWTDHINRKIIPFFYLLLLSPSMEATRLDSSELGVDSSERQAVLVTTLQTAITSLVNASHATGPFFLGTEISFVDIAFAPWIIRLSRVLSYYREFPRPEVGTRWFMWVDAIEQNEFVKRTVSDERSYHSVYGGVTGESAEVAGGLNVATMKRMAEIGYAERVVRQEGFGLGGDLLGRPPAGVDTM